MNQERLDQIIALAIGIVGLVGCSTPDSSLPFCTKHAGRYESRQSSPGIFRGYCVFPDNTECEVRAFYEGRCQPGQIRSTDSSPQKLHMLKLIAELAQRGIKLHPASMAWGDPRLGKGWLGTTLPSGASGPIGLFETSFERLPSDLFLIRATESITAAQDMEHRIPAHVEAFIRPYKPEIDALKYYRCDKLIVVYMALPPRGFDPSVDQALTETCGPAFAHYPTDPSVLTSPIPSPAAPLGFGAPSSGAAPIGPPTTTRDLIAPAQLIVIGEVGPVIQRRTYSGYSSNGQLLDGFNETGMPVPQVPITDFEVKVERVIKDDGTIASGKPIILRMSGNATPEMKATTRNSDYPFSYTGDRHLFLLTRNPDGTTYSFYYGPWSRLLIDSDILRVSNGSQDLLKLDGSDVPIRLDDFIRRVNE